MKSKQIGFIGLGDMGQLMAQHLVDDFELSVYNRTKSKTEEIVTQGAIYLDSPADIAQNNDYIILMVSDDEASEEVLSGTNGVLSVDRDERGVIINMSTITARKSIELATHAAKSNFDYVEAPVSGTLPHARNQGLVILTAGNEETVEEVRPILERLGRRIDFFGKIGNAIQTKLVVNGILAVQTAVLAEGMTTLEKAGIDHKKFLNLFNDSALGNVVSKAKGDLMLADQFDPLFRYKYIIKDLNYAKSEFTDHGIDIPLIQKSIEIYEEGPESLSDLDFSAIYKVYKDRN